MSLLMEALRKAEEAKRKMQQDEQAPKDKDARKVASAPPAASSSGPKLSLRPLEPSPADTLEEPEPDVTSDYIRDNFTANRGGVSGSRQKNTATSSESDYPPVPEPGSGMASPERETGARTLAKRRQRAAASVFVAKQNPARNRKTVTILVGIMLMMLPVGGAVLWYLQSMSPSAIGINPAITNYDLSTRGLLGEASPAATTVITPVPQDAAPTLAAPAALAGTASEELATEVAPTGTQDESVPVAPVTVAGDSTAADTAPAVATTQPAPVLPPGVTAPVDALAQADPASSPTSVLEVSRSGGTLTVNPALVTAYDRMQTGDLLVAGQLYQEVLNGLPNNRDALRGLALVRLRQGELAQARELYARLLQLNPRDPMAHAGLLQTMQAVNPVEHEATLKSLLDEYPDVAPLGLALGNLYASQQRWSEAQGAYYNALLTASRSSSGPVHPDYAFNLAVSLEQLNQRRAALEYYRQAQALARAVTPGFDPQLLNSRLAYLEQNQP